MKGGEEGYGFARLVAVIIASLALVLSIYAFVMVREAGVYGNGGRQAGAGLDGRPVDFAAASEKVMPSLVKIDNLALSSHPALLGSGAMGEVPATREGTGFFIDPAGLIITNFHVVDGAELLKVITVQRREYEAEVVGADPLTDIALVRIKPDFAVKPATLGDSDKLKVGQWVLAMGNPLGLEFLTAAGIISGFGPPGPGYMGFYDFIQTDANIKPGNSGGPLVDYYGNVVGVDTAYLGPSSGIGFAIPINRVRRILPALKEKGRVVRGFLGLVAQPVTPPLAERLKLSGVAGALISGVQPGGPADRGGLKEGDVVVGFDGVIIPDERALYDMISTTIPGKKLSLDVVRDGLHKNLMVTLGELKTREVLRQQVIRQCGLTLQEVNDKLAEKLKLPDKGGLLVLKVVPGCPSYRAGLMFGDVIVKVEGRKVDTAEEFYRAYSGVAEGGQALVQIYRQGRPQFLTLGPVE